MTLQIAMRTFWMPVAAALCSGLLLDDAPSETAETFLSSLNEVAFTSGYERMPKFRFEPDRILALREDNALVYTYQGTECLDSGLIRWTNNQERRDWWIFSEDRKSAYYGILKEEGIATLPGGTAPGLIPPGTSPDPLEITLESAQDFRKLRVWQDRIEGIRDGGTESWKAIRLYSNCVVADLPGDRVGCLILSREKPTAWWTSGTHLYPCLREDLAGPFVRQVANPMNGFLARISQFAYLPLSVGRKDEATAAERNGLLLVRKISGESSEDNIHALLAAAVIRQANRDHEEAVLYSTAAWEKAKAQASPNAIRQSAGLNHSRILANVGKFSEAQAVLDALASQNASNTPSDPFLFDFNRVLGEVKFGLRDYPAAAQAYRENCQRARAMGSPATEAHDALPLFTCELAGGNPAAAKSTLAHLVSLQRSLEEEDPDGEHDTWKLALACALLERWDEAMEFVPTAGDGENVTYQEFAHILTLTLKGEDAKAASLAQEMSKRLKEVDILTDVDEIFIKLTAAIALRTPETIQAAQVQWQKDVEQLKSRPLENYILARVITGTMRRLEQLPGRCGWESRAGAGHLRRDLSGFVRSSAGS